MARRLSYKDSCIELQRIGLLEPNHFPTIPEKRPMNHDDEMGATFFETQVQSFKMENVTLPRSYFVRSRMQTVAYINCDFSESLAPDNEFSSVNFKACDLTRVIFRNTAFKMVNFSDCLMDEIDLSESEFMIVDFTGCSMMGALVDSKHRDTVRWSKKQLNEINWQ